MKKDNIVAIDVETNNNHKPFCISFTWPNLKQEYYRWKKQIPQRVIKILENKNIMKIGHNISYDIMALNKLSIKVKGKLHDTMLLSQISLPHEKKYGLKDLMISTELPFKKDIKESEQIQKYLKKKYSFTEIPYKLVRKYNLKDTYFTMLLFAYLEENIKNPIYKLEKRLIRTKIDMETNGIKLNIDFLKLKLDWYERRIKIIQKHFYNKFNIDNINSPQQLSILLYKNLELDRPKVRHPTSTGTDNISLILLKNQAKCIRLLLEYRKLFTKVKTFLKPFLKYQRNGYIYPHFNQMGHIDKRRIRTGRFSSSEPNFQNIERGSDIRELIIPRKGCYFLDYDYKQIEMVLFAFLAKDKMMMRIYLEGGDIHTEHKKLFVDPYRKDVDHQNREIAKSIGFEIIYGIGVPGMTEFLYSKNIFLDKLIVKKMLEGWYDKHPSLFEYRRELYRELRKNGFIKDLYGRKYFLPLGKSYMAVNYICQGMSANILKEVMPKINKYIKKIGGKLLLTIHDELLIEMPLKYYKTVKEEKIKDMMENPGKRLNIPIVAEYKRLKHNWGEK